MSELKVIDHIFYILNVEKKKTVTDKEGNQTREAIKDTGEEAGKKGKSIR